MLCRGQGDGLLYREEGETVVLVPLDDVGQGFGSGAGGGRVVHQHDALGLLAGLPHDVAEDGACTGLAAHSVLGADYLILIVATVTSFVLGQDRFSWTQLAAIVLICASVYLVEVAESNKQITSKLK